MSESSIYCRVQQTEILTCWPAKKMECTSLNSLIICFLAPKMVLSMSHLIFLFCIFSFLQGLGLNITHAEIIIDMTTVEQNMKFINNSFGEGWEFCMSFVIALDSIKFYYF